MKHWTDRIILWAKANWSKVCWDNSIDAALYKGRTVQVLRDSSQSPKFHHSKFWVGAIWLQENFSQNYAQFIAESLERGVWWDKDGVIESSVFDSPSYRRLMEKQRIRAVQEMEHFNKLKAIEQAAGRYIEKKSLKGSR